MAWDSLGLHKFSWVTGTPQTSSQDPTALSQAEAEGLAGSAKTLHAKRLSINHKVSLIFTKTVTDQDRVAILNTLQKMIVCPKNVRQ